jgi:pimeloyl-ACP methyl ester carboxylesterase
MILHGNIIGEGKPLFILHGFLGMGDNWKTLARQWAEVGYQVHLVDQRNHGRSFHSDAFSYELMAKDLLAYCEAHGLGQIDLLGHSMGGKTAMTFACTYPERLGKLVVADIAPRYYDPHHQHILKALQSLDFDTISSRQEADAVLADYIGEASTRQFLLKNLYREDKDRFALRINLEVLSTKVEEVGKPLPEHARFEGPVLFVRGERSNYILDSDKLLIKRHFPNGQIRTVSGAGHWLHAEKPAEFYQIVTEFL